MIHIFDKETRKYLGTRELEAQDGEEIIYSTNDIIGTSDGLCLDKDGNYYYEKIEIQEVPTLPEPPQEVIEILEKLKTLYNI